MIGIVPYIGNQKNDVLTITMLNKKGGLNETV